METQKAFFNSTKSNVNFLITNSMVRLFKAGLSTLGVFALMMTMALTAGATEKAVVTAKDRVETVQLKTVEHNLEAVVAALKVVDPAWVESLKKQKTLTGAKTQVKPQLYYFVRSGSGWREVEEHEFPNCAEEGDDCGAISDQIVDGQPAGPNITYFGQP